jgi:Ca-activated chloride channel family protein
MQATYALSPPVLPLNSAATVDLLITFRAGAAGGPRPPRRPLNLSVVIDRSGSMAGTPLKQAIKAAETLVKQLRPDDVLSVVVYDDAVNTILPPLPVDDQAAVCARIRQVQAGGCTNLSGGWLQGCEHVLARKGRAMIHRVLLLTDGQANMGVTDPKALVKTAQQKAEQGVITTALGFGSNFNEDLLIDMAKAAGGNFYFIETPDDAADVFRIEAESLAAVAAQHLTVTLTAAADGKAELGDLLSHYPAVAKGKTLIVPMGDVYAGEDKLLALEVKVPAQKKKNAALPLLSAAYTYEAVAEAGARPPGEARLEVALPVRTAEEAMATPPAGDVLLQISRVRIAKAKEVAVELADEGKNVRAAEALRELAADLRRKGLDEHFEIAEEISQLEHFAERIEDKALDPSSRKEMRDQSYQARARGRSDLAQRGVAGGSARDLETTTTAEGGVELECVREGGKLRVRVVSAGYDPDRNVQFPRNIREEGVHYVVEAVQPSADGTFYRTTGKVRRLVRPGEEDRYRATARPARAGTAKPSKVTARTAADLEATDSVGDGVLVQCVKEGSKLRARVVSDGYDPDANMRFPRDIRAEGVLFVVDEVIEGPGGKSYIACGKIRRLVQ